MGEEDVTMRPVFKGLHSFVVDCKVFGKDLPYGGMAFQKVHITVSFFRE
jgi:hypothetical protein